MFGIKKRWQEARGDVLKQELNDSIFRINALDEEANISLVNVLTDVIAKMEKEFGPLKVISNANKKELAKGVMTAAKRNFHIDIGGAYAGFILASYLEASTLPGEDARYVETMAMKMIDAAFETVDSSEVANQQVSEQEANDTENNEDIGKNIKRAMREAFNFLMAVKDERLPGMKPEELNPAQTASLVSFQFGAVMNACRLNNVTADDTIGITKEVFKMVNEMNDDEVEGTLAWCMSMMKDGTGLNDRGSEAYEAFATAEPEDKAIYTTTIWKVMQNAKDAA